MGYKQYCKDYENIENYEKALADNFVGWVCHHRKGVDIPREELKASKMYYHRPAEELIFLTESEHDSLHKKGKPKSKETKKKMSEARKGKYTGENNPMYGRRHTEESKKKISEAKKSMSEETRNKIAEAKKGMRFFNNGKICIRAKECPDGFTPGRLRK